MSKIVLFRKHEAPSVVNNINNSNNSNNNDSNKNGTKSILKKESMFDRKQNPNTSMNGDTNDWDTEMGENGGDINDEGYEENDDIMNFDCDLDLEKEKRMFEQQHKEHENSKSDNDNDNDDEEEEGEIEDDDIKLDVLFGEKKNNSNKNNNNHNNNNSNTTKKKTSTKMIDGLFDDDDSDSNESKDRNDIAMPNGNKNMNSSNGSSDNTNKSKNVVAKKTARIPLISSKNNQQNKSKDEMDKKNSNRNKGKMKYDTTEIHRILREKREKELANKPIVRQCRPQLRWEKPESLVFYFNVDFFCFFLCVICDLFMNVSGVLMSCCCWY